METHCLRQDQIPGASRLILDYLYRFPNLASFYAHAPYDPASYPAAVQQIQYPAERRKTVADALAMQNPQSPLIEKFRRPDTVVVATGQQVGYLGGPAYTVYKALTAIRVAAELDAQGIPAVPLFWLASEDHDLAEVNHAWFYGADRQPQRYQAEENASTQSPVGGRVAPALRGEEFASLLGGLPFDREVIELATAAYDGTRSYTEAFQMLVQRILAPRDILFLDPLRTEIRQAAAPLLAEAVQRFPELVAAVQDRTDELLKAGYHAQVHLEAENSFFFLLEGGQRLALKARQGDFIAGKRSLTPDELAQRAHQISPNALLRPVLQDYLLPTACLVGGPAEIAYLAQNGPIYEALLQRKPVFLPRSGFTLFDERAARSMDRYQLSVCDFFVPEAAFVERIGRTRIPSSLLQNMKGTSSQAQRLLEELRCELLAFDPTLAKASERSRQRVAYQFEKLERKASREVVRREEQVRVDSAYLRGLVYPEKHLQERLYSILPFLATHGAGVVDTIADHVSGFCPDHCVLAL